MTDTEHAGLRWKAAVRQAMLARPVTSLTNSQRFFLFQLSKRSIEKTLRWIALLCGQKNRGNYQIVMPAYGFYFVLLQTPS
jgi:hypothetical protein